MDLSELLEGLTSIETLDEPEPHLFKVGEDSGLPEDVMELVDYARTNFPCITAPFPDIPIEKMKVFYWICYNFNELSRITGERVEFTVSTNSEGGVSVDAWCYENTAIQNYLPFLIDPMESEDFDSLKSGLLLPGIFFPRADPLLENKARKGSDDD